jgi:DNA-directed RNA polymerase subunit RPC12/RpoP
MRRRRRHRRWHTPLYVIGGIVFVILLPVLLPVALFLHSRDQKRMRALAEIFACLSCGRTLGADSLKLADEAWANYVAKLNRDVDTTHPTTRDWNKFYRPRLVKDYDAVCPNCGTYHKFIAKERTFILTRPEGIPLKPGEQRPRPVRKNPPSASAKRSQGNGA